MAFFNQDIVTLARSSTDFRREILTQSSSQVVIMSVEPGDDVGEETHGVDQLLFFIDGRADAILNGERSTVVAGSLVAVPAGTRHNFINTGPDPLKLFTIYAPPEEEPGTLHRTKAEAVGAEKY
jgi:mannose-6-phosphate isomerase-like protein (cupin superfamily)